MKRAVFALADASEGELLESCEDEGGAAGAVARVTALAGALPDLYAAIPVRWDAIFDPEASDHAAVQSFVFVSSVALHVVLREGAAEDVVLVGTAPPESGVGALLASARSYAMRHAAAEGLK